MGRPPGGSNARHRCTFPQLKRPPNIRLGRRYRVFIWGIIFFFVAGIALCYFWCCAVPPGYQHSLGSTAYTVTGTSFMVGPAPVTGHPMETQPLFHPGMHYSSSAPQPQVYSSMQFAMSHGQGMPPPPPYQFAQLYPTHVSPALCSAKPVGLDFPRASHVTSHGVDACVY
jgi:hypothetical protein